MKVKQLRFRMGAPSTRVYLRGTLQTCFFSSVFLLAALLFLPPVHAQDYTQFAVT